MPSLYECGDYVAKQDGGWPPTSIFQETGDVKKDSNCILKCPIPDFDGTAFWRAIHASRFDNISLSVKFKLAKLRCRVEYGGAYQFVSLVFPEEATIIISKLDKKHPDDVQGWFLGLS